MKASTTFKLFYPDSNTISALNLFNAAGDALTPTAVTDGTDNPAGFKSKVITFAAAAAALFCTPTFTDPANPVQVYLTRDESGTFYKQLDETVFDSANPGRPTPAVTSAQEYVLYETLSNAANGGAVYTVKAPSAPVCKISSNGKDPLTGVAIPGNNIVFRWTGKGPTLAEVEADVEDIVDPAGFFPVSTNNATTYAESSVGLSMLKSNDQIVPRDGLGHTVALRLRYNVHGDVSAWTAFEPVFITYEMAAPNPPATVTATRLRDRNDVITDLVKIDWTKAAENPGTGLDLYCVDYLGKKHLIHSTSGNETTARVENLSRFVVQDVGPAVARPYRLYAVATNQSAKSAETFASQTLNITSKLKPQDPITPDDLAGTARDVINAVLKAEVYADVVAALGTLPEGGQAIVYAAIDKMVLKIKDVVAKGGSVELENFGVIAAKWTNERLARNPSNGDPVVVPAYRSLGFTPSKGFKAGTRAGTIMTDAQAEAAA